MKFIKLFGIIAIVLILLAIVISLVISLNPKLNISYTSPKSERIILTESFNQNIDKYIGRNECETLYKSSHIWVGATLADIKTAFSEVHNDYTHILTFKTDEKQGDIYIDSPNSTLPYKIGTFYKFDLVNKCYWVLSMAHSGSFYDPNFDVLKEVPQ